MSAISSPSKLRPHAAPQPSAPNAQPKSQWAGVGRTIFRWVRVFWPLALTLWAGFVVFPQAILESIYSTPHPQLVYGIFAVAAATTVILAYLMYVFSSEHSWLEVLVLADPGKQQQMMKAHRGDASIKAVYHLLVQTRGLNLRERQMALENELMGAESNLMARLAVPNFLGGALVGLGLVGTFIGLLGALQDLAGVFSAMTGGSAGADATAMFTTMIERLKAPMQGMGTAFVASLYGLLGSLVLGLISSGVKGSGDRMLGHLREYVNRDVYGNSSVGVQENGEAVAGTSNAGLNVSDLREALVGAVQEQERHFSAHLLRLAEINERTQLHVMDLRHQLADAITASKHQSTLQIDGMKRLGEIAAVNKNLSEARTEGMERLAKAQAELTLAIGSLRSDLQASTGKGVVLLGRGGVALLVAAVVSALTLAWSLFALPQRVGEQAEQTAVRRSSQAPAAPLAPAAQASEHAKHEVSSGADAAPQSQAEGSEGTVLLKQGDSLWRVAQNHGLTVAQLLEANPHLTRQSKLMPGQPIKLPAN